MDDSALGQPALRECSATLVLETEDHGEVGATTPLAANPSPLPTPLTQAVQAPTSPLPPTTSKPSASKKSKGSSPASPRSTHSQRISEKAPNIVLHPPRGCSSYEESSGSTSHIPQLEWELEDLRKHKAQEEGTLRRRLKNLAGVYDSRKERYAASVRKKDTLRAKLEGVEESRAQVRTMEANLEDTEGHRGMLQGSDAGRELLAQSFNQAMTRTLRVMQDKLEEVGLDVSSSFWDVVRDDVPPPDPSAS
ncbi:hypothetical protein LIER_32312 [Lithospermum erythrorhizon]|uniref:Uncharacterized protein n=1 Tax=Lithospermum erythrorhizon TaxID=34254 RepID=A0AAV3RVP5_LITER